MLDPGVRASRAETQSRYFCRKGSRSETLRVIIAGAAFIRPKEGHYKIKYTAAAPTPESTPVESCHSSIPEPPSAIDTRIIAPKILIFARAID